MIKTAAIFWIITCFNSAALSAPVPREIWGRNFSCNYDTSLQAVNSKNEAMAGARKIAGMNTNSLPVNSCQLKRVLAVSGATFFTEMISGTCKLEFFKKSGAALGQLITGSPKIN